MTAPRSRPTTRSYRARSGPSRRPSRSIAVTSNVSTPTSASRSIATAASMVSAPVVQPWPTALPSRTSIATAMRPAPWASTRRPAKAGSSSAAVPIDDPRRSGLQGDRRRHARRGGRRPPRPGSAPRPPRRSRRSPDACAGTPVRAPSRSTTWIHRAPASGEPDRDVDRIGVVRRLLVEVTLPQSNDATAPKVDRRQDLERACSRHGSMIA